MTHGRGAGVVVVGGAATDYVVRVPALPTAERPATGDRFLRTPGGKGFNQAIAAARLGARVTFVGRVGRDREGDEIARHLAAHHAAAVVTRDPELPTASTAIHVDAGGRKQTASAPGASRSLEPEHVPADVLNAAAAVAVQLEIPLLTVAHVIRTAHAAGARVVLDADPPVPLHDEILRCVDILTLNHSAAEVLTGHRITGRREAESAARALVARGPHQVVLGVPGGRAIATRSEAWWLHDLDVAVVDTTGAGDACAAVLAVGAVRGWPFDNTVQFAHAAAALATTELGAYPSILRLEPVTDSAILERTVQR